MSTFLAFAVAIAKLFYSQPWSKILLLCFAVFVGGCICGVKLTRGVVKAVTPDAPRPERTYPLRPWKNGDTEPATVEAKPVAKLLPAAAEHLEEIKELPPVAVPAPSQPSSHQRSSGACVGGSCYAPTRRFFGRWR